jgi:hypothetical protein
MMHKEFKPCINFIYLNKKRKAKKEDQKMLKPKMLENSKSFIETQSNDSLPASATKDPNPTAKLILEMKAIRAD